MLPPLAPPTFIAFRLKGGYLEIGGSQRGHFLACRLGRSLDACHRHAATPFGIKLYNFLPLPYGKGTDSILTSLTGGGRGWGGWHRRPGRLAPQARAVGTAGQNNPSTKGVPGF